MIDTLIHMQPKALERQAAVRLGLEAGQYALLTLHRPSNVDDPDVLARLLDLFTDLSRILPIVFPVHPRTKKQISLLGFSTPVNIRMIEPVDYLDSLCLQSQARLVLTDSGGIQEETSFLGVPCLTLRRNTERPVTVELGTSTIVGNDAGQIRASFMEVMENRYKKGRNIPLWDGHTAQRVADCLRELLQGT
jgi:UDP-N-acetylglucosamine 2-epimerase (non-hydrolysing)